MPTRTPATASSRIQGCQSGLQKAFEQFAREHPEVAEAMEVMNLSFSDYLQAIAALKESPSVSTDASGR
jgi:hypothetical protein